MGNIPQRSMAELYGSMTTSAVTVAHYFGTMTTFIATTCKRIYRITSNDGKMIVNEVLEKNFTLPEGAIPTPKLSLLDVIRNTARKHIDSSKKWGAKVYELLSEEIKSGNVTVMKMAGAALAGFAIGFIFGAAESTLRKFTPIVTCLVSDLLSFFGVEKGKAMEVADILWSYSLSLTLAVGAASLGFIAGAKLGGPVGGLVGAGAGLVGYMVAREAFK